LASQSLHPAKAFIVNRISHLKRSREEFGLQSTPSCPRHTPTCVTVNHSLERYARAPQRLASVGTISGICTSVLRSAEQGDQTNSLSLLSYSPPPLSPPPQLSAAKYLHPHAGKRPRWDNSLPFFSFVVQYCTYTREERDFMNFVQPRLFQPYAGSSIPFQKARAGI